MRVVVATTWFPDSDRPSAAPFVSAHVRAIGIRNDVQVVHLRLGGRGPARTEEADGIVVTRVPVDPRRPREFVAALDRLRAIVDGADVVHTMAFSTLGVLAPLYPVVSSRWVHTEHWTGVAFPDRVSETWRRLAGVRNLLRLPRRVSAVSTRFVDVVQQFARRGAVDLIPNVVGDTTELTSPPGGGVVRLVAVGALVPQKRPLLAVDTVRSLVDGGTDATLEWVGDGPLREATQRRIRDCGLADRVRLVGRVPPADVPGHLDRAHLFFLPTDFETFLVAGAEALARGRPVVLPACGPYTDFVDESVGVLAADESPDGLAAAIRTAHARFGDAPMEQFRAAVLPRFGADRVGQQFDEFYERAVG